MRTIQYGSRGQDVASWQTFLRGGQVDADGDCTAKEGDAIISDGKFGPATRAATVEWQKQKGLTADGIVGPDTWKVAVADSFPPAAVPTGDVADHDADPDPTEVDDAIEQVDKTLPSWPPRPAWAKPLVSQAERDAVLGKIEYVAAPIPPKEVMVDGKMVKKGGNPEAVRITNGWAKENIAQFSIPQLSSKPISMHKAVGPQFQAWLQACEKKGVLNIISFGGCWVPRFVRGSRTRLSNHTWGSAIDINVPWNGRGRQSALVGKKGCVREMAELCYDFGLFWGGHYKGAPEDGMHFEARAVLTPKQLQAAKQKYGV